MTIHWCEDGNKTGGHSEVQMTAAMMNIHKGAGREAAAAGMVIQKSTEQHLIPSVTGGLIRRGWEAVILQYKSVALCTHIFPSAADPPRLYTAVFWSAADRPRTKPLACTAPYLGTQCSKLRSSAHPPPYLRSTQEASSVACYENNYWDYHLSWLQISYQWVPNMLYPC